MGLSLGGEVLLGAVSMYHSIAAIAADGATRRSLDELVALPSERPLVLSFTARVLYAAVQLLSGQKPPLPLLDSMSQAGPTEFLLIAAGEDEMGVKFNELFTDTLPGRELLCKQILKTYSDAGIKNTWQALLTMCDLFRTVALRVAAHFGFEYPSGDDERVSAHLRHVHLLPRDAQELY